MYALLVLTLAPDEHCCHLRRRNNTIFFYLKISCFLLWRRFVVHLLVVGLWATRFMICGTALWNHCFRWSDPHAINQHCWMRKARDLAHVHVIKGPGVLCSDVVWEVKIRLFICNMRPEVYRCIPVHHVPPDLEKPHWGISPTSSKPKQCG